MLSAVSTALSGMLVAEQRAGAAAANLANAQSAGGLPGSGGPPPYAPLDVVQSEAGAGQGGTIAAYRPATPAYTAAYDPGSPDANGQGVVAMPAVDPVQQMTQLATARQSFAANLKTLQTALSISKSLLDILG